MTARVMRFPFTGTPVATVAPLSVMVAVPPSTSAPATSASSVKVPPSWTGSPLAETVVAVCDPDVWRWFSPDFGPSPSMLIDAVDLGPGHLDELAASVPKDATIVGIGGGVAMDVAKWIHWRRGLPLIQVPTLPSVNACFTRMTALRDGGRVRYEGDAVPDEVLVDYAIFSSAPPALVRAGIGDVLSCHTALMDWRIGVMAGYDPAWDDDSAGASMRYIDGLRQAAPGIHGVTDEGIRSLMELHREIGWRCHEMQHARELCRTLPWLVRECSDQIGLPLIICGDARDGGRKQF